MRNVSTATKNRVFKSYGVLTHSGKTYEIDHLIPLELGGSNAISNLFPEPASPRPGFHEKDKLENALHKRVCDGRLSLKAAQHAVATNWVRAYRRYIT